MDEIPDVIRAWMLAARGAIRPTTTAGSLWQTLHLRPNPGNSAASTEDRASCGLTGRVRVGLNRHAPWYDIHHQE